MDRAQERARLGAIRRRVAALAGSHRLMSADGTTTMLDVRGNDGSLIAIASFTGHASPDEIELATGALDDLRFLLRLLDRAIRAERERQGHIGGHAASEKRQPDHTTEAAMLCSDPAFRRFLMDEHGLESPANDERTAQRLRGLLGVTSRREINQSEVTRRRWTALREEFRKWKRRAA